MLIVSENVIKPVNVKKKKARFLSQNYELNKFPFHSDFEVHILSSCIFIFRLSSSIHYSALIVFNTTTTNCV